MKNSLSEYVMKLSGAGPNSLWMLLAAAGLLLASGLPAAFSPRRSRPAQFLAVACILLGSLTGLIGLAAALHSPDRCALALPWHLPWGGFAVELDALGAVFLLPVFIVPALGAVYGLDYWRQSEHPDNGRSLSLFYGVLAGAMVLVVLARDAVLFLIAWEIMALAAFFLATTENEKPEVRRAGWIYLVATHAGTVCLLALFALMKQLSGSFAFCPLAAASLTKPAATALFFLTVIGFGFKAGLMPLHAGMIGADAKAPGHVSAVLSGVLLKMGLYGLLRILTLLPVTELWNGELLLGLGAVTGILGAAFAIGQSDLKRLLAYSSVENIGIITIGIGLALLGRALHRADLILLGLGGALLHVWNHSLFKSLLFLNAEAVIGAVRHRDINRMGGLGRSMPRTAGLFLLGAVAICALPPLNGFVSKWLIYLGLFRSVETVGSSAGSAAGIGAVALALIGALALACFVRVYSAVFLGPPRDPESAAAHDPRPFMQSAMAVLAAGCIVLGLLPQLGLPLIRRAAAQWIDPALPGLPFPGSLAPVQWISAAALALLIVAAPAAARLRKNIGRRAARPVGTWRCGYARPTPRMQYTATSFGEMLVNRFSWALRPRTQQPDTAPLFPGQTGFSTQIPDTVLERIVLPLIRGAGRQMMKLRLLQQGRTHIYLLYIFITMLFLFCWGSLETGR